MKNRRGFTLIELLTAIAILAILLLISLPIVVNNLGSVKNKSYDYQISFFLKAAERYSLENSAELVWQDTEVPDRKKAIVTLRELISKRYVDDGVVNQKTGEIFDPDETIVIVYKYSDGYLEFIYGDESPIVNPVRQQYILRETAYNVMSGVYANVSGEQSTKNLTASCIFNGKSISCDELLNSDKELGKYYVTYKYGEWQDSRIVEVVESSRIIITSRPESERAAKAIVTIEYPDGSSIKTYSDKNGAHNYDGSFEITKNQTITANCVDKYGLRCATETKKITNLTPSVEYEEVEKGMTITASWPNSTGMELTITGVKSLNGTEYKCKIGNKETDWSENNKCSATGLESGKAYTVVVYARDKVDTIDELAKTTTIYTAKDVTSQATSGTGTCPTETTKLVQASGIYDSVILQGSCSTNNKTCSAYASLTSDASNLPNTMAISCSGVTSVVNGGNVKSSTKVVSCAATGSRVTNQMSCTSSTATCSGITSTVSGTCTSSVIKSSSTYNCSSLSKNACSKAVSSTSVSYYSCMQGSYGKSTCYSTTTTYSTSYYGCNIQSRIYEEGPNECTAYSNICTKYGTSSTCVRISGGRSSCSTTTVCKKYSTSCVAEIGWAREYLSTIYVPNGCSTTVTSNVQYSYQCSGYVSYWGTCTSTKATTSTSYYDCSVKSTCTTQTSKTVYSVTYPNVILSSNKTVYYKEYSASNIIYSYGYVINYSSSLAKPRKSAY